MTRALHATARLERSRQLQTTDASFDEPMLGAGDPVYMGSSNRPNAPTGPHNVCPLRDIVAYTIIQNKRKGTEKGRGEGCV